MSRRPGPIVLLGTLAAAPLLLFSSLPVNAAQEQSSVEVEGGGSGFATAGLPEVEGGGSGFATAGLPEVEGGGSGFSRPHRNSLTTGPARVAASTGGITWLTANPVGNRCVRFGWGGSTLRYYERFQMKIGGNNAGTVYRWTGRKKSLRVCGFPVNDYTVWVRKTGTPWRTAPFTVGRP